jgi:hypothetical protein
MKTRGVMSALFSSSFFNSTKSPRFLAAVLLIFASAALRLMPHAPNVTPIAAMALFGGATLQRKEWGLLLPLFALFLSDCLIGFHDQMLAVYSATALTAVSGFWLRSPVDSPSKNRWLKIIPASLFASLAFYFITNSSVWLTTSMYAKTSAGYIECLVAGIPFLGNSLCGDLFFAGAFFGVWALMQKAVPQLKYS